MNDKDESALELLARELGAKPLEERELEPIIISLPIAKATPHVVAMLKHTLLQYPGEHPVHVRLVNGSRTAEMTLPVTASPAVRGSVAVILGRHAVAGEV